MKGRRRLLTVLIVIATSLPLIALAIAHYRYSLRQQGGTEQNYGVGSVPYLFATPHEVRTFPIPRSLGSPRFQYDRSELLVGSGPGVSAEEDKPWGCFDSWWIFASSEADLETAKKLVDESLTQMGYHLDGTRYAISDSQSPTIGVQFTQEERGTTSIRVHLQWQSVGWPSYDRRYRKIRRHFGVPVPPRSPFGGGG